MMMRRPERRKQMGMEKGKDYNTIVTNKKRPGNSPRLVNDN